MKKVLLTLVLVGIALFSFAETLVIKGSNTIFPVAQLWIEELKDMYPDLSITLEGAGSSTGISALFNGTTHIANSSRWLKESELEQMSEKRKYFIPVVLGYDGIAVIVNPNLGIDEISIEELAKIYTGKITRWNQLNPNLPNQRIVVYSRNSASGTYETFVEKVLKGERMVPTVQMLESTQAEIQSVAKNQYAIAYTGVGYVTNDVKVLSVDGVQPTKLNILNSVYPISRPLYMFVDGTNGYPETGPVKQYLTFGLSKRGQELVEQAGYVAAYGF
ncbi:MULTISPECIES: phosphate ABC transporter substrate-binding protein PstS family protein [Petrotoga]|uniref:Phosphate-binding protein n=2 Tax=Petrotoga sibirica TaxID=156202 RepID=A0A4R8EHJ3_9BACT|nr:MULTISPECIES: phosphate ABC transporter substrate-binding protein PstS family protein [Petrotoga]POZ87798.1 phosphate ABC transporter substrate-binding protein [Petrotoga sibirica DSM 13575]POZ89838.1 phosphate ABC transporter substrate-binding protein [Petrotoga sp. SL27]TDX11109.1 phosphate ABC transporter substrate-binding protein (PhoT family) [Petrotoga sibirica]